MSSASSQRQQAENTTKPVKDLVLAVNEVVVSGYDGNDLITNATFAIHKGARMSLVGENGCGKSTLLKSLVGFEGHSIKSGTVATAKKGQLVEYVPQHPPHDILEKTLLDAVTDHLLQRRGGHAEEWKAPALISELGFRDDQFFTKFKNLSGGEINRAMLACALVVEPDVILLDEPTNHLDTEGIIEFESSLKEIKMPFLIISHDRSLLDRFTDRTLFLAYGKVHSFDLPYSKAKVEFDNQRQALLDLRAEQEKRRDQIEDRVKWLKPLAARSEDMAQVYRAHQTKLRRYEENMVEVPADKKRQLQLKSTEFQGQRALQIYQYSVAVPDGGRDLYSIESLMLSPGDRAVIMGINGSGKSTLLNAVVATWRNNDSTPAGIPGIRLSPQAEIGFYDQKQRELDPESSLFDHLSKVTNLTNDRIHATLAKAGYPYNRHHDHIATLSGGERARLQLLAINEAGTNCLILDEPTNHLDLMGIEKLEQDLLEFEGTLLFVSHDRCFVERVANRFFLIKGTNLIEVSGTEEYYSYLVRVP
jgi:ATP-binding cassette, subfamily F, member 3